METKSKIIKLVVITTPEFFQGEAELINTLFKHGLELLHVRKPSASEQQMEEYLSAIDGKYMSRVALHDHFELAQRFGVGGLHLNSRNNALPSGWSGRVSRSCHSFDEVLAVKDALDYCFLSPIFDSVSKIGYKMGFSEAELRQKRAEGVIDSKIFALSGVTLDNVQVVESLGFGGCAVLGYLWQYKSDSKKMTDVFVKLKDLCTFVPG